MSINPVGRIQKGLRSLEDWLEFALVLLISIILKSLKCDEFGWWVEAVSLFSTSECVCKCRLENRVRAGVKG